MLELQNDDIYELVIDNSESSSLSASSQIPTTNTQNLVKYYCQLIRSQTKIPLLMTL